MIDKKTITSAAQKFASRGQIDEAIAEWEKLLAVNQDGNVYNTIGDLYLKKRDHQNAVASFEKAANIFREDGFYPKAIALFKKILNFMPEEVSALIALAQLNAERGFTNQAVDELQKVAGIFINRNNIEKAIEVYERILRLAPQDTGINIKIAELAQQAGLTGKACQSYGVVASNHLEKGEFEQAEEYYKKVLEIDPQNSSAIIGLSNLFDRTGNTETALQYLNKAISANPEDQSILLRYARLSIKAEKIDEAKQTLIHLTEKDPSNLDAKKLLGIIYVEEVLIEQAWNELKPCIDDAISDKNWADALAMLNNFDEVNSTPVRRRFVDIYRGNGDTESLLIHLKDLGELFEYKGINAEALKVYKEALEIKPDDPDISKKVKQLASSDHTGAEEQAGTADSGQTEEATPEGEGSSLQYLEIKKTEADFYVQQGLNEEAVKIYEELLEAHPDNEAIRTAMIDLQASCVPAVTGNDTSEDTGQDHTDINSAMNEILKEAGVDDTSSDERDYEAEFQKGIDFRREGQLDKAIEALQTASGDPFNVVRNSRMLALCYAEQGNYSDAVRQFKRALEELSSDDDGYQDVQYELAESYLKNGDYENALIRYSSISKYDPMFRDVAQKIESLQSGTEQNDGVFIMSSGETEEQGKAKKNRISYL
ncbi:MAG: tetratricopeptide repeat protein [Nitrospiraceae bacterium]|nr:MAG: tetratricopeptide repeat protein [Nitrospiraceae bacterium]